MPWLLTPLWPLSAPFSPSSRWVLGTLRVSFFTTRKSKFIASAIQYLGFIKSLPRTSILASKESGECRVLWPLGWPAAEFIGNLECMLRVTGASTAIMGNYSGRQKLWSWASSSSPKYWDDAARKSSNASAWQTENKEFFISAGMDQGTERRPFSLLHFRKKHGKAIYVTNLWLFLPRKLFFSVFFRPSCYYCIL